MFFFACMFTVCICFALRLIPFEDGYEEEEKGNKWNYDITQMAIVLWLSIDSIPYNNIIKLKVKKWIGWERVWICVCVVCACVLVVESVQHRPQWYDYIREHDFFATRFAQFYKCVNGLLPIYFCSPGHRKTHSMSFIIIKFYLLNDTWWRKCGEKKSTTTTTP